MVLKVIDAAPSGRAESTRFNPCIRAGRDEDVALTVQLDRVSIHVPARGTTRCAANTRMHNTRFDQQRHVEHQQVGPAVAPGPRLRPRSARCSSALSGCLAAESANTSSCMPPVLIRAPAQSATLSTWAGCWQSICFNPRACARRDTRAFSTPRARSMFQSTRPRGARHHHRLRQRPGAPVSIHAPARGATTWFLHGVFA